MKHEMKRKGFTLVELLIVIVVIGILSAMMMLSSTEAVSSAKASNIVSNLRNLKTAALAFYVDHLDQMEGAKDVKYNDESYNNKSFTIGNSTNAVSFTKAVGAYMNASETKDMDTDGYKVLVNGDGDWYVTCEIKGTAQEKTSIQNKLAGRAKSVGLCDGGNGGTAPVKGTPYKNTMDHVAMYVR